MMGKIIMDYSKLHFKTHKNKLMEIKKIVINNNN